MPKKRDPIGLKVSGNGDDNAFDEEEQKEEEDSDPLPDSPPSRSTTTSSRHRKASLALSQNSNKHDDMSDDIKPLHPSRTSAAVAAGLLPTFKDQVSGGENSRPIVPSVEGTPVNTADAEQEPRTLPAVVLETLDGGGVLPRINAKNTVGTFAEQGGGTAGNTAGNSNQEVTAELMVGSDSSYRSRNKHLIWAAACAFTIVSIVVGVVVALVLLNSDDDDDGPSPHNDPPTKAPSFGTAAPTTTTNVSSPFETKLTASDGASLDFFGYSAAISGDTIVVGSYRDGDNGSESGSAYVYTRSGTGVWTEQAKLTASDGATGDLFGYSVAIDSDSIAVGAIRDDDQGSNSGSTYIYSYTRSSSGSMMWTEQAKLTASDGAEVDLFGSSVAISGNSIIVGSPGDDNNGRNSGSAYIFVRSSTGNTGSSLWTEQARLAASDGFDFDRFGDSVAIDRDSVIVGSPSDDDNGDGSGSAYIYIRLGILWTEQAKLTASDGATSDDFGRSVAIWGDWAVIGANEDDDNGSNSGSAFIYTRSGATWMDQTKLMASDGSADDYFGFSVAMSGDIVIIGSYRDGDNGSDSGSVYAFIRSGGTWTEQAKMTASDGAANDNFGRIVAIDEGSVVIGANQDTDNGSASGSAYAIDLNQIL